MQTVYPTEHVHTVQVYTLFKCLAIYFFFLGIVRFVTVCIVCDLLHVLCICCVPCILMAAWHKKNFRKDKINYLLSTRIESIQQHPDLLPLIIHCALHYSLTITNIPILYGMGDIFTQKIMVGMHSAPLKPLVRDLTG